LKAQRLSRNRPYESVIIFSLNFQYSAGFTNHLSKWVYISIHYSLRKIQQDPPKQENSTETYLEKNEEEEK